MEVVEKRWLVLNEEIAHATRSRPIDDDIVIRNRSVKVRRNLVMKWEWMADKDEKQEINVHRCQHRYRNQR